MFNAFANVTSAIDKFQDIKDALEKLALKDVLVGIPQEGSSRKSGEGITNAELAYIHTHGIRNIGMRQEMQGSLDHGTPYSKAYEMYIQAHGSPLWNSPPRPIIEPAIEDMKGPISEQLRQAIVAALEGGNPEPALKRAGMLGQNAARGWFVNPKNNWAPNSPLTIAKKKSDKPLINTGELRKSITFIVRERM